MTKEQQLIARARQAVLDAGLSYFTGTAEIIVREIIKPPVLEWRRAKGEYANGEHLTVNGVYVGSVSWVNDRVYSGYMAFPKLPDLNAGNHKYDELADAKTDFERQVTAWFERFR